MRLGLLADIHESVDRLGAAVAELRARNVDSFVMLGDVLDHGERVDETVALLSGLPGVGVWGNHDFGLCGRTHASVRDRFSVSVLDYFARLRPFVVLGGLRFQHIDPHLDPEKLEDLWLFPTASERIAGLARCSQTRVFTGHLHGWGVFTPDGQIPWLGEETFMYQVGQRYLTTIHAVADGWCALFDSDRDSLEPIAVA
ncbi:MAG TPA: metallophosphoesterase family protein [Candidatus Eisenbacteria bacterium]